MFVWLCLKKNLSNPTHGRCFLLCAEGSNRLTVTDRRHSGVTDLMQSAIAHDSHCCSLLYITHIALFIQVTYYYYYLYYIIYVWGGKRWPQHDFRSVYTSVYSRTMCNIAFWRLHNSTKYILKYTSLTISDTSGFFLTRTSTQSIVGNILILTSIRRFFPFSNCIPI